MTMTFDEDLTAATMKRVDAVQRARAEVMAYDDRVGGLTNVDSIYAAGARALGAPNYRELLKAEGAAKVAFHALRAAGAKPASKYVAMDAKQEATLVERFPNGDRLGRRS